MQYTWKEDRIMAGSSLYTANECRMLWYLKRQGGAVNRPSDSSSLIGMIAGAIPMSNGTTRAVLRSLEQKCVLLRTYLKGKPNAWGEGAGNPLIRVELIDTNMPMPPEPKPVPQVVIDARENEELYGMTSIEPSPDAIILALLHRNEELQDQLSKLQDIVVQQQEQISKMNREASRKVPEHLTSRIRDALTPEQWDEISHSAKR